MDDLAIRVLTRQGLNDLTAQRTHGHTLLGESEKGVDKRDADRHKEDEKEESEGEGAEGKDTPFAQTA